MCSNRSRLQHVSSSATVVISGVHKVRSEIKILADELTAPLATSRSALAMLLAGDLGDLNDQQREYLQHALELDDYMIGLVGSWMDIDRLSKGQVVLEAEPCNIGAVVKLVADERVQLQRNSQWPMVLADPLRLKQILMNIVDIFKRVEIRARTTQNMCILTFHDQKRSSSRQRAAIVAAINTNTPTPLLGVRIARLLAEAHGGSLQLNPHASNGTKIHLKLPLAKQMSLLGE